MRLSLAISSLLTVFLVSQGAAFGQNLELIPRGPHWSAPEFNAVHGPYDERELQILVTSLPGDGGPASTSIVGLGPDYLSVRSESGLTIIDTKLKRLLQVDPQSGRFQNTSLYASADFAKRVLTQRMAMRESMQRAGVEASKLPDSVNPFWVESQLGAERNPDAPLGLSQIDHDDGSKSILFEGDVVAIWSWTSLELPPEQLHKLRLYLQYYLTLHPRIRREILAESRLPERIRYKRIRGEATVEEDHRFRLSSRRPAKFPLSPDLRPLQEAGSGGARKEVLPTMLAAVAGRHGKGPKPLARYVSEALAAFDRGAYMDAWLTLREAELHHHPRSPVCETAGQVSDSCFDSRAAEEIELLDAQVRELLAALDLQEKPGQAETMIEKLIEFSRADLSKSYMIKVLLGRALSQRPDLSQKKGLDAGELIASAIKKNPYVPVFYKDLGDHFARNYDFVRAYTFYDLGRALPGGSGSESLREVSRYEGALEKALPDFF